MVNMLWSLANELDSAQTLLLLTRLVFTVQVPGAIIASYFTPLEPPNPSTYTKSKQFRPQKRIYF